MRQTQEQTYSYVGVNGEDQSITLHFTQLHPKKALKVAIRFSKIVGGPIAKAFSSLKKVNTTGNPLDDVDFDMTSIGSAVEHLFERVDEDEIIETIDLLLTSVKKGPTSLNLDDLMFHNDPFLALKIAKKSAEVNFSDFFAGASGVLAKLQGVLNSKKETSTGGSGDQS